MKYKIKDESNDRQYFTIIPNYILNHSSAIDKAIYIDMKRVAGENGRCFMTEKTMCKRNGIGDKTLHKSLKYLIDHKWIEFVGTTPSKTRPIKTYKILDVWKKNSDYFQNKKIPSESGLSKDTLPKKGDTRPKQDMIPVQSGGIRRTLNKKIKKKKKYTSLSDLKEKEFEEIAEKYGVLVSFVRSSFDDLENYCGAHGRRYKNYKLALMNFVKKDAQKKGVKFSQVKKDLPITDIEMTEEQRKKALKKLDEVRKELSGKLSFDKS